jgi:deoxyribodipyrimidine photolyase-related protein
MTTRIGSLTEPMRQILGWWENVRSIYWLKMPDYKSVNFLEAKRPLPDFY